MPTPTRTTQPPLLTNDEMGPAQGERHFRAIFEQAAVPAAAAQR